MCWLCPVILLHELYIHFNDASVDDFDNKLTILLCLAFMIWSARLGSMLQPPRPPVQPEPDAPAVYATAPLRLALAACAWCFFAYIAYTMNEAKLVYILYKASAGSPPPAILLTFTRPTSRRTWRATAATGSGVRVLTYYRVRVRVLGFRV